MSFFLTTDQACAYLKCSRRELYRIAERHGLTRRVVDNRRAWDMAELAAVLREPVAA